MSTYKIFAIKKYSQWNETKINKNGKSYKLNDLVLELTYNNNGYHFRIDPDKQYTIFGDIDGHIGSSKSIFIFIKDFLCKYYDILIELDDIFYTQNNSKEGSYHYSIPKYNCSCHKLKEIIDNMKEDYVKKYKNKKVLDSSIYSKHWFRYPNQAKEQIDGSEHIIIYGTIKDFIVEYIPDYSINVDNKIYKVTKKENNAENCIIKNGEPNEEELDVSSIKKTDFTESDIENILGLLSNERLNSQPEWIKVGMCLKNINKKYLILWNMWSKESPKYKIGECAKKWETFKLTDSDKMLSIGSLIQWAKDDNLDGMKKLWKEHNIKKIISKKKDIFPKNELNIDKIISSDRLHYIKLTDEYCPISENNHLSGNIYLEMTPIDYCMKCKLCEGKMFPCEHVQIDKKELKQIFNTLKIENFNINVYTDRNEIDNMEFNELPVFDDALLNKLVSVSLDSFNPTNLAKIVHYIYKDIYNYGESDKWYKFKNHKWHEIKGKNYELREIIADKLIEYYDGVLEYYKSINSDPKKIKKIKMLKNSIGETTIKNNILTEMTGIYSKNNEIKFLEKLDSNPNLIGFENGIYDISKWEFRDGKPDDFISMSVGHNYSHIFTDKIKNIKKFFEDIMPDEEDREYLLTLLGSMLIGINFDENYSIFTGGMRNGKSTLTNILMYTFGDYYGDIQNTLLTKERPGSNVAQPELLEIAKKRVIISSENEAGQKINTGFIKQLTGNDRVKCRALFSNDIVTYIPQFKIISLFNDIPEVDKPNDIAFWNRCKCLNFKVKFTDNPREINEKKINKNLKEEIKTWGPDCILYFISYCKKYKETGLVYTKKILEITKQFEKNNNPYEDYVDNYIEKSTDSIIQWTALKTDYCEWYIENIGRNIPRAKEIKDYFEKKVFKEQEKILRDTNGDKCRGWKGWKKVDIENDNE